MRMMITDFVGNVKRQKHQFKRQIWDNGTVSGINFEEQLCDSKKNLTKRQKCGIILSVYILGKLKSVR